ncbi:unnamed protein product [Diabrotica balteata]|uniref:JmjC domain-containing protein n=1 Tax=Diabrotica balteata TaxID=107213 RepID=A0A9N9X8Z4_DIABA|nr:unnamed protein product [Diabrotica balteata]
MGENQQEWKSQQLRNYGFELAQIPRYHFQDPNVDELMKKNQPVVITDSKLVKSAVEKWNLDYLEQNLGKSGHTVFVSNDHRFKYFDEKKIYNKNNPKGIEFDPPTRRVQMKINEFMRKIRDWKEGDERLYLQQSLNSTVGPNIVEDYLKFDWHFVVQKKTTHHWGELTSNVLFVSQEGNVTPCHYDEQQNLFAQISGFKRCILFPPDQFECLYPHPVYHPHDRQSMTTMSESEYSGSDYVPSEECASDTSVENEIPVPDDEAGPSRVISVSNNNDQEAHATDSEQIRGRKRPLHPELWKRKKNSLARAHGGKYVNRKVVARHRPRETVTLGLSKEKTLHFSLRINGENIKVCKKYFTATFQISDHRVRNTGGKSEICGLRSVNVLSPKNKVDVSKVVEHINSIPVHQSHYTRTHNPNRKYLHPDLTIRKMYNMYVDKCNNEWQVTPVKEKMYYSVFSTKFNLHFKQPLKDTCSKRDAAQVTLNKAIISDEEKRKVEIENKLHLRKAEQARSALKVDKEKSSSHDYVFTFDLQKALAFPKLTTSVAYYKRNMYVYNLGVHPYHTGTRYMYVWSEVDGSRGSQEISACLKKHLENHANDAHHIVMYADSCGGQNRNIKLTLTLMKLLQSSIIRSDIIDIKFVITGHSYLPNDADFGIIESNAKKHSVIYDADDWYSIIKNCRPTTKQFEVTKMNRSDFLSTLPLEEAIVNRKISNDKVKLNWLNMRWIRLVRSKPSVIYFKETLNDDVQFDEIDFDHPDYTKYPKFKNVKGCETILGPGDVLYIPICWWHHIESLLNGGATITVNFWYKGGPTNLEYPLQDHQKVSIMRNVEKMLLEVLQDPNEVGPLLRTMVLGRYTDP